MEFRINSNIIDGEYDLCNVVSERGFRNIGVVVDQKLEESCEHVRKMIEALETELDVVRFTYDHSFEPSYQYLDKVMNGIRERKLDEVLDVFIGIGGGSSMDTAKGLAILCRNSGPSINYKGFPKHLNKPLPVIAIPSTAGSGSEVAFNASFVDEDTDTKMGINYVDNYPIVSILDTKIVSSAPRHVFASSGCDALVHSLEGFVSKESSQVSRMFSAKSFHLIQQNLPILLEGKGDQTHWANMQWAAVFAMWGLANSSSGPAGAMSYYLGTHYRIPHGTAGAVFIGKISAINHGHGFHKYSDLYGWDSTHIKGLDCKKKSQIVVDAILTLLELAGTPKTLSECGVPLDEYQGFYRFADTVQGAFQLNPVMLSSNDLEKLLI